MKKILLYHPTGNQNVRALLDALYDSKTLHSFHTTIAVFSQSFYYPFLKGPFKKVKRRTFSNYISKYVKQYPILELAMMAGMKKYKGQVLNGSSINKILAYNVAKFLHQNHNQVDGVFGYPFGSEPIFQEAKKYGIKCIYEQTTGYYKTLKKITQKEKQINKDWASSISIYEEPQEVLNKLDRELKMADYIIAASSYIKKTLEEGGIPANKIHIIPYGFPNINPKQYREIKEGDKIKVLFAGNLSQLKGLSYLNDALQGMDKYIELTLIGSKSENCKNLQEFINSHNYLGTLSHEKLLEEMHKHDLFVFPSLCDGFGMVVSEAMSQGTPVIASENSCGPDIIINNENGWIVPIRDSESIKNIFIEIIRNPFIIKRVGENAVKTAQMRPWSIYKEEVSNFLQNI